MGARNMTKQAARVVGVLAGLLAICVAAASAQERGARKPQTDRTVTVTKGARLSVNNDAGEVVLRTWDRDSVRVQASHNPRTTIDVQTAGNIVTIRSRAAGGPAGGRERGDRPGVLGMVVHESDRLAHDRVVVRGVPRRRLVALEERPQAAHQQQEDADYAESRGTDSIVEADREPSVQGTEQEEVEVLHPTGRPGGQRTDRHRDGTVVRL